MKILGLSAGSKGGNAEIALKEALSGVEECGHESELLRLYDLDVDAITNSGDINRLGEEREGDDGVFFWERLLDSDGWIIASSIFSRSIPGQLKVLADSVLGPKADVTFQLEMQR